MFYYTYEKNEFILYSYYVMDENLNIMNFIEARRFYLIMVDKDGK